MKWNYGDIKQDKYEGGDINALNDMNKWMNDRNDRNDRNYGNINYAGIKG